MTTKYAIVPATEEHIGAIASDIRGADRAELWAADHHTPEEAMRKALDRTVDPLVGLVDGVPVVMWGVSPFTFSGRTGIPWLVSTNRLEKHFRIFLKGCKLYIDKYRNEYDTMFNFVDERNAVAIRWLKWLGFTVEEARPYGKDQLPFCVFRMENE